MAWNRRSGRDLKAERVRAGLTQAELAGLRGVSRQRVTAAEAQYRPTSSFADRVLAAIDTRPQRRQ